MGREVWAGEGWAATAGMDCLGLQEQRLGLREQLTDSQADDRCGPTLTAQRAVVLHD